MSLPRNTNISVNSLLKTFHKVCRGKDQIPVLLTLLHTSVLICLYREMKEKKVIVNATKTLTGELSSTAGCHSPAAQQAHSGSDDTVRPMEIQPSFLSESREDSHMSMTAHMPQN